MTATAPDLAKARELVTPYGHDGLPLEAAVAAALAEARESAAKIADDYSEWTIWGQYANAAAAEAAAGEIAKAIRLGRPLTTEEIGDCDRERAARIAKLAKG